MKHTKETWKVNVGNTPLADTGDYEGYLEILGSDNKVVATWYGDDDKDEENAKRIVDCVNACADMENPETEIAKLRADRAELIELCRELLHSLHAYHEEDWHSGIPFEEAFEDELYALKRMEAEDE